MVSNGEVSAIFAEMAEMLDIQGEGYHRVMAYRRAAENVAALGRPLEEVWEAGEVEAIPGIGKTLASKIDEYMRTGELSAYAKLREQVPAGVVEMLQIPDVGPRKAAFFWQELGFTTVAELKEAALAGKLRTVKGMGERSELKILSGIEALERRTDRITLGAAWGLAHELLAPLEDIPGVVRVAPAGSLRRMRDTVGDLDLLVALDDSAAEGELAEEVMVLFRGLSHVDEVLLSGPTKTSIRTHSGIQVDLRVVPQARWGTALQYFTGSQAHNVRIRGLAQDQSLSLNEYAFKREDETELLCVTEQEVYAVLGLPFIPPELREDRGEIEAAMEGSLPDLIQLDDVRGDLQFHSTWSDGQQSLLEMAEAAMERGLDYALVTDHSHGLGVVQGLDADGLRRQREEIDQVNRELAGRFRLLAGIELEVKADSSLDLPDEILAQLDLVVASVHTGLRQSREQFTARALAALRNPHVDVLAHPTGRLIGRREGADLDVEAVLQAAAEMGVAVEINANPWRLDLNGAHVRRAIELGVTLVISSDAHTVRGFDDLRFGVGSARRGWATAADVLNTRSADEVLSWADERSQR
jgi:DNA polymerase (family 10)